MIAMKRILVALLLLTGCYGAFAQDVIKHQRGEDLQQYLLDSVKFVSKDYMSGFVKFRDGSHAMGPVNISTIEQRWPMKTRSVMSPSTKGPSSRVPTAMWNC